MSFVIRHLAVKLCLLLVGVFLVFVAATWLALSAALAPQFDRLEQEGHLADKLRVVASIEALNADMRARVLDYAHWDDTYSFIAGGYPDYTEDNFDATWLQRYGVDLVMFVDPSDRVIWSLTQPSAGGADATALTALPAAAAAPLARLGRGALSGVARTPSGLLVYAIAAARRSDGGGAPRGQVIMGRYIADAALSQQTQVTVDVATLDAAAHAARLTQMQDEGASSADWTTSRTRHSLIALRDLHGNVIGAIHVQAPRRISSLSQQAVGAAMIAIAIIAFFSTALIWWALNRFAVRRMTSLVRHISAQTGEAELEPFAHAGNDEISRLAAAYNELGLRLKRAQRSESQAQLERELAASANRLKSAFMANVSHELRTPLNAIIGYAQLIAEDLPPRGQHESLHVDLARVEKAARHVLAMVNDIIDLSNIEAGRVTLKPTVFEAAPLIEDLCRSAKARGRSGAGELIVCVADNIGVAYTDEARLRQCLDNVIDNACKNAAGEILVSAQRIAGGDREMLRIDVTDRGARAPAADLDVIFDAFARVDEQGGVGLGLSIARTLSRLLGGDTTARHAEAGGVMFSVVVPAILQDGGDQAALDARRVA